MPESDRPFDNNPRTSAVEHIGSKSQLSSQDEARDVPDGLESHDTQMIHMESNDWALALDGTDLYNSASSLNLAHDFDFSDTSILDSIELWPSLSGHSQPRYPRAVSSKSLAEELEKGCVIYIFQTLNLPDMPSKPDIPHSLHAMKQQYYNDVNAELISNLAETAIDLMVSFAGLDNYIHGTVSSFDLPGWRRESS